LVVLGNFFSYHIGDLRKEAKERRSLMMGSDLDLLKQCFILLNLDLVYKLLHQ